MSRRSGEAQRRPTGNPAGPARPDPPAPRARTGDTTRWVRLASWIVPPILMAGVYTIFAQTSDADNTAKAWMAVGFGFVLVVWLTFRILVEQTALARAVASGDAARILRVTEHRRDAAAHVYHALAHDLAGDWRAALDALASDADAARIANNPPLAALAAAIRVEALVETGDIAGARRIADTQLAASAAKLHPRLHPQPQHHAALARARLLVAEGDREGANRELKKILDDIRAGSAIRERAKALS